MKFLSCPRCFSTEPAQPTERPVEITNPLVVTKRPGAKTPPSPRKGRFPGLLNALTSWPRRRPKQKPRQVTTTVTTETMTPPCVSRTIRKIEPPYRRRLQRPPTRTQRLIRLYEERAHSPEGGRHPYHPEHLLEPPAGFGVEDHSLECHQNFKNKLNTLDFRRMNTVALEQPTTSTVNKNEMPTVASPDKFARKTILEDFLKERLRIEQTMIDLINGRDLRPRPCKTPNEERKVRFHVDGHRDITLDVSGDKSLCSDEDCSLGHQTEIKLSVDPHTKVEDFYVEKTTTYLKDKTVEDKALVLKIAPKDGAIFCEKGTGTACSKDDLFCSFGKLTL